MNSISKENNFNFPRILVRRIILNWQITPKSTTHIYRIKGGGGLLLRNIQISRSYEHFKKFREICFAHIFAKFEYFVKIIIYSKSPDHVL